MEFSSRKSRHRVNGHMNAPISAQHRRLRTIASICGELVSEHIFARPLPGIVDLRAGRRSAPSFSRLMCIDL
jgi:hypothetical protein